MARPDFPRNIIEFQERFPDEAACLDYLAASRWPEGFRCPACGGERAWVLDRRHLWECAACRHQASVTAGTVMHRTRTPLRLWFWAAYLGRHAHTWDLGQAAPAPAGPLAL
jgi:Zn ribbon nucleic-acid-binding protein